MKQLSPTQGPGLGLGAEDAQQGTRLAHFELLEQLGVGGFAVVYRARDLEHDREVALKVLLPGAKLRVPDIEARFQREILLLQRLSHPNIVRLFEYGEDDDQLWLSMELVVGEELSTMLAAHGAMAPSRALPIVRQILSALGEPHAQQIVHRDLKPGNIMLTASPDTPGELQVKLLDFGTSKAFGAAEAASVQDLTIDQRDVAGTPRYMAVEQISNDTIGPFTDVYAVCVILIEMLTGKPALSGSSAYEILTRLISQSVVLPGWLESSALGPVLRRGTSRIGVDRYPDAQALREALDGLDVAALDAAWQAHRATAASSIRTGPLPPAEALDTGRVVRPVTAPNPPTPTDASDELATVGEPLAPGAPRPSKTPMLAVIAALAVVVIGAAIWLLSSGDASEQSGTAAEQPRPTTQPVSVTPSPPTPVVPDAPDAPVFERELLTHGAAILVDGAAAAAIGTQPRTRPDDDDDDQRDDDRRSRRKRRRRDRDTDKNEKRSGGKSTNPFAVETH